QANFQVQITGRAAADARAALAGQSNALTFDDAGRNRHLQRARLHDDAAVVAELRRLELDRVRPALERVLQIDLDLGDVILARLSEAASPSSPTAVTEALPERTALAEQGGEEV